MKTYHDSHQSSLVEMMVGGYPHMVCNVCGKDLGMQPGRDEHFVRIPDEGENVLIIEQGNLPNDGETSREAAPGEVSALAERFISPASAMGGWVYIVARCD